jgi:hypothetical protein
MRAIEKRLRTLQDLLAPQQATLEGDGRTFDEIADTVVWWRAGRWVRGQRRRRKSRHQHCEGGRPVEEPNREPGDYYEC